jgi:hypothetical protein
MLVELLNRLLNLAAPSQITDGSRIYTSREVHPMQAPLADPIEVKTLTGFVDAATEQIGTAHADMIQIHAHDRVVLTSNAVDDWGRRAEFVIAAAEGCRFQFGNYSDPENFVIGLQTMFVPGVGDFDRVLKLASNIAAENVTINADDGVSQQVSTRQGIVMKNPPEPVSPRVVLAPFRTFREITQPSSEFLLRFRSRQGQTPLIALHEADGGAWREVATKAIKAYLSRDWGKELQNAVIVA